MTPPRAIITRWRASIARRSCLFGSPDSARSTAGPEGRFMRVLAFVLEGRAFGRPHVRVVDDRWLR
jgi:hypothetical protein